jgi:PAP2 superfamily
MPNNLFARKVDCTMTALEIMQTSKPWSRHLQGIWAGFSTNRISYAIAISCLAIARLEAFVLAVPLDFKPTYASIIAVLTVAFFVAVIDVSMERVRLFKTNFQGALLPALWNKIVNSTFTPERLSNIVHATIFISIFMMGFAAIKDLIPAVQPFSWDPTFLMLDEVLHFGKQPYEWLAVLLNNPLITYIINFNYNIWFFVMFGFVFWHSFAFQENRLRQHFLVAFMITWFLGTCVFGTIFSSYILANPIHSGQCSIGLPIAINSTRFILCLLWTHFGRVISTAKVLSAAFRLCLPCTLDLQSSLCFARVPSANHGCYGLPACFAW